MLAIQEKIDVRRHLGVPFAGLAQSGLTMGIRTLFQPGQLEFYMNNLQPAEESVLTGRPFGTIRFYGQVVAGQTVTATINGTAVTYTVLLGDAISTSPLQSVANGLANAINLAAIAGIFGGGNQILPSAAIAQLPGYAEVTLVSSFVAKTFVLTSSAAGALTAATIADGTNLPSPMTQFYDALGNLQTITGYIAACNFLQSSVMGASTNMGLLSAGGSGAAQFRPYEMRQRIELYDYWRGEMGRVLSVGSNIWGFRGNTGSNQGGSTV